MSVIGSNILAGASGQAGYFLTKSLRFRASATAYLNRTPAGASNRKTFTINFWLKRGELGTLDQLIGQGNGIGGGAFAIYFDSDGLRVYGGSNDILITNAKFRDPASWYMITLAMDTTQATASDRAKLYINGVEQTYSSTNYPTINTDLPFNQAVQHTISGNTSQSYLLDGYLAEFNFIDGQALTPSSFGETSTTTGVWIPKKYTGTYGTNGFYLDFEDTSSTAALGYDAAGSNDWTVNGISLTAGTTYDSMTDVPTNTNSNTANYCTWNPLINGDSATSGNLDVTNDTARGTQELLKYDAYWEITSTGGTTTAGVVSGTGTTNTTTVADTKTYGFRLTTTGTLDYINITDSGSFTNITTGLTTQQFSYASAASATTGSFNAGQRPFAATPPSGFVALNTFNLPTPTIGATASSQANKYMNISLYTGTGSSQSITGLGFQPDWTWIKGRSGATDHGLYDAVRGVQNQLESNTTTAETAEATGLTAFGSDGFTVGALAQLNTSSATYVGWNWKANGAGSANTDGTIASTVSANTTAGFSIVTFTGNATSAQTVGHGLGVTPTFFILKSRGSQVWNVYSLAGGITGNTILQLNDPDGAVTGGNISLTASPTTIGFGSAAQVNGSGVNFVAYCFAPVAGYSAFGSYTGNGSTDGPFIFTGFRLRFLLIKNSSTSVDWVIEDTSRDPYNVAGVEIFPNLSNAESSGNADLDILSNGFKIRRNSTFANGSGNTIIYMAFAETPFKFSNAR